jgi:hypothetical protein
MTISRFSFIAGCALIAVGALSACTTPAGPKVHELKATMSGAKEVPPKASGGSGTASVWYNEGTRGLQWTVTFTGLSGPATAAHFHGPAAPDANAGVVLPLGAGAPTSPVSGTATLTEAQAADLMAGKWYVNVHTQANPGGEIRGQVVP